MRPKACRSLLVLVLAGGAAACEGKRVVDPGPTGPPPGPLNTVQARVEGRVSDFDTGGGVARAVVRVLRIVDAEFSRAVNEPAWNATTDENGEFSFAVDVPANWTQLILAVNREGYESSQGFFARSSSGAHLPVYRTLAIRPGQSIEILAGAELANCFDDGLPCRRVFVESPSGESVDLAVTTTDSQAMVGVDGWAETHTFKPPRWQRQLTVSGGEVWVYGGALEPGLPIHSRLILTATRR